MASILRLDALERKQETVSRMVGSRGTGQHLSEYLNTLDKASVVEDKPQHDGLALLRDFKSGFQHL